MGRLRISHIVCIVLVLLLPVFDYFSPFSFKLSEALRPVAILAFLGLGLNILTGYTGLLNLGVAAFMAIGAYSYGILSCDIYPFQLGFWGSLLGAISIGGLAGVILGLPTIRLSGDYLAIVTLGFGEIVQDLLKNLDVITKGTQGINPLPYPSFLGYNFNTEHHEPWYYLLLALLCAAMWVSSSLEHSRIGRSWIAIREDELAARCMGVNAARYKLFSFALCAAYCSFAGALWASFLGSTGDPGNYDFQISIIALCMVIVGGLGSIFGSLLGALVMVGFNSIVLVHLTQLMARHGLASTENVYSSPNNWKYLIFGLALIVTVRFRPQGLLPSKQVSAELKEKQPHHGMSGAQPS